MCVHVWCSFTSLFFWAERCCEWTDWVATPCSLTQWRGDAPQTTLYNPIWDSHTLAARRHYNPCQMSTKHPWSNSTTWHLETQLNRDYETTQDHTDAPTEEEQQRNRTAHRCSVIVWSRCRVLEYPVEIQAELDKLYSQERRPVLVFKRSSSF